MSHDDDLFCWSIKRLAEAISKSRLSVTEVVEAFLARIEQFDDGLHAFVEVDARSALKAARAADDAIRSGRYLGSLHGIPIAIKDSIEVHGYGVRAGYAGWRHRRAQCTAPLMQSVIAQGMIVLGKNNMVAFASGGGWGINELMGTPWNPWDSKVARAPGGSSSGSGVAVAARLAPCAIGTDTGGSVRLPASWCGLTALKASVGRISTEGLVPLSPTLDSIGPMALSVEDVSLVYRAMAGGDELVPPAIHLGSHERPPGHEVRLDGIRLGAIPDTERKLVAADVLSAYDQSLKELSNLGADVETVALPLGFEDMMQINSRIMKVESHAELGTIVSGQDELSIDADAKLRILAGSDISEHDYLEALNRRQQLIALWGKKLGGFDAVLTPTTPTTAPVLADIIQTTVAPSVFTHFANFLDLCALALPNGIDGSGLPVSLQIVGKHYAEMEVLKIGHAYQQVTDWHERSPGL